MNEINPLQKKLDDNDTSYHIRYLATIVIVGLTVVLGIALYVFGDDVQQTLDGSQAINKEQTLKLEQLDQQNKALIRQVIKGNELNKCLLQMHIGGDFSRKKECQRRADELGMSARKAEELLVPTTSPKQEKHGSRRDVQPSSEPRVVDEIIKGLL